MNLKHYLAAGFAILLVAALVACPQATYAASAGGLALWWNVVLPSLLPFFVGAELLMGLGAVHCLGVLLEPVMRPLFRVPGSGGFVLAVSLASGFPMGAMLASQYRQKGVLSKKEGERLLSFASTAGPLFMTGAVATGLLGWPEGGPVILLAHYLSCLVTGLALRFHGGGGRERTPPQRTGPLLGRAAAALVAARRADGRPLGTLLGDAVKKAFASFTLVGGFIISFSVLIELVGVSGLTDGLAALFQVPGQTVKLILTGFLEVTNGCRLAAQSSLTMGAKVVAISAMIAWGGLSVQGQAASFAGNTDLSLRPFYLARALQAALAALFAFLLLRCTWLPPLPAAALYVTLSLGRKYLFSLAGLALSLLIPAGVGLTLAFFSALGRVKLAVFKINQPRS